MKRAFLSLLILLCASTCWAGPEIFMGVKQPAASCTTLADSLTDTSGDAITIGYWASGADKYIAGLYISAQSYAMCGVEMYVKKTGTPTQNIRANLYEWNSGQPGTLLCTGDWVAVSTFGAGYGWVRFPFSSACSVTTTHNYEIGLESDSINNTTNAAWLQTSGTAYSTMQSPDNSTWSGASSKSINYKTYK